MALSCFQGRALYINLSKKQIFHKSIEASVSTQYLGGRGLNARVLCYHVKGLSRGVYPAGPFALAHAVSTRGADHLRGRSWAAADNSNEEVLTMLQEKRVLGTDIVRNLIVAERATTLADTIGRCKGAVNTWTCTVPLIWKAPVWDGLVEMINAAAGLSFTSEEIEKTADRINILERLFNVKQGILSCHDSIPQKPDFSDTQKGAEECRGHEKMVKKYYRLHGFDIDTGIPLRNTLEKLDLGFAADEIESHGVYSTIFNTNMTKNI
ncbi:MAG: aldehyde ferredoxin oxidoreductase C-terminal domain-containing protein [Thermodesulfobacteriota bacterium]|nr:aldehyde ferredoxin oxidoreductase C-terminal domain-containing protein [Thermodesulfobacteriota bacterium]